MLSLFVPLHPLEKTDAKSRDLSVAVKKLLRIRDQFSRSLSITGSFRRLDLHIKGLQKTVRTEAGWRYVCGTASRHGVWQIKASFSHFQTPLRELDKKLASAGGRGARKLIQNVDREAGTLELAIARLGKAVDSASIKVMEFHGRDIQGSSRFER